MCFHKAMQATCCWGHFDGTKKHPSPLDATKPSDDELAAIEQWECEDQVARYLLSQHLPNTTTICLYQYPMAHLHWSYIHDEYMAKSMYV
jgi:hypothetical protein